MPKASASGLPTPSQPLVEALAQSQTVLITSHANPDGDAIGSEAGLARTLLALGKTVQIWNADAAPTAYASFLAGLPVHVGEQPPEDLERFDLTFFVECPTVARTGFSETAQRLLLDRNSINVDHHLGNAHYASENWVEPEIASVSIQIYALMLALGAQPDPEAMNGFLLGLVTDTGGFRFSNTTEAAHLAAARMIGDRASAEEVARRIYESRSEGSVRLLAEVLQSLERVADGAIASIVLSQEMLQRANATFQDGESIIDYPRSIRGVEIAVLFKEIGPQRYKVSLRSRGAVSVEPVARRHGGGGHKNAAGCEVRGALPEVRDLLMRELQEALQPSPAAAVSSGD